VRSGPDRWWWYLGRSGPLTRVSEPTRERITSLVRQGSVPEDRADAQLALDYAQWSTRSNGITLALSTLLAVGAIVAMATSAFRGAWVFLALAVINCLTFAWRLRRTRRYVGHFLDVHIEK
jgi:hypothetical protein